MFLSFKSQSHGYSKNYCEQKSVTECLLITWAIFKATLKYNFPYYFINFRKRQQQSSVYANYSNYSNECQPRLTTASLLLNFFLIYFIFSILRTPNVHLRVIKIMKKEVWTVSCVECKGLNERNKSLLIFVSQPRNFHGTMDRQEF